MGASVNLLRLMAIQKQVDTEYGVPAEYWRIIHLTADFISSEAVVIIAGYLTAAARTDGSEPLMVKQFRLPFPPTLTEVTRADLYTFLMLQPFFEGGTED